jgi:3D (Asp-Asp-Asp) domain-containing protein
MKRFLATAFAALTLLGGAADARTLWSGTVSVSTYNSIPNQTDSTPFITATGTRTRYGVVAVSRDILSKVGYGAKVRIVQWTGGRGCNHRTIPQGTIYAVEDTMAKSQWRRMDIWLPSRTQAINFGRCNAVVEVYR